MQCLWSPSNKMKNLYFQLLFLGCLNFYCNDDLGTQSTNKPQFQIPANMLNCAFQMIQNEFNNCARSLKML